MSIRLGACLAAFSGMSTAAAIEELAALGIDHVDLPTDSTLRLVPSPDDVSNGDFARWLAGAAKRLGLTVSCVSNSRDTQGVAEAARRLRELLPDHAPEGRTW